MSSPPRTKAELVQKVLLDEYDAAGRPDLKPFIEAASDIVDNLLPCAARKGLSYSAATLELIERWLAAHGYQMADPGYTARTTAGASGQFIGQQASGLGIELTRFGLYALNIDWTGCLKNLNKQQRAGARWLGKPVSKQIPYSERN